MRKAIQAFEQDFARWGIRLPDDAIESRQSGHLTQAGWSVLYDFGTGPGGDFLDYYAALREGSDPAVTDDWHVRLYESGERALLPTVLEAYMYARDPTAEELERARRSFDGTPATRVSPAGPSTPPAKPPEPPEPPEPLAGQDGDSLREVPAAPADAVPRSSDPRGAIPDIGAQVGLDPTLAGFEPLPSGNVVASWMITPPYVSAVADPERIAPAEASVPEPSRVEESIPVANADTLIEHDPPGDAASFALTGIGGNALDSGGEVVLRDSKELSLAQVAELADAPSEPLRDGLVLLYPPSESDEGAPIEKAAGADDLAVPQQQDGADHGENRAPEASADTSHRESSELLGDSPPPTDGRDETASDAADEAVATRGRMSHPPSSPPPASRPDQRMAAATIQSAVEDVDDQESKPTLEIDRRPRPPAPGTGAPAARRPSRISSPLDVAGVADARADLEKFRPWWYRTGSRRAALIAAGAIALIVIASMVVGHHSDAGGTRPAERRPAQTDSSGQTDATDGPAANSDAADTTGSPAAPAPAAEHASNAPAVESANRAPAADSTVGTDDAVARPTGPQSVPPIVRSGGPSRRPSPGTGRRGASPAP